VDFWRWKAEIILGNINLLESTQCVLGRAWHFPLQSKKGELKIRALPPIIKRLETSVLMGLADFDATKSGFP